MAPTQDRFDYTLLLNNSLVFTFVILDILEIILQYRKISIKYFPHQKLLWAIKKIPT